RSDGPGKGSEFVVRLPAAEGPRSPESPPAGAGAGAAARPRRRILVADGNRDTAGSLAMILRLAGPGGPPAPRGPRAGWAAGGGAARHRDAEAQRVRGRPPDPRATGGPAHGAGGDHRLGSGGGQAAGGGGRLRPPPDQAGGPLRPGEAAGGPEVGLSPSRPR